jgi:hypothetical protein
MRPVDCVWVKLIGARHRLGGSRGAGVPCYAIYYFEGCRHLHACDNLCIKGCWKFSW